MKGIHILRMMVLGIAAICLICQCEVYAQERGAKSLFFGSEMDQASKAGQNYDENLKPGVMYWIELSSPGKKLARVSNDRIFHSGDRIRLHVTVNGDGYLHVFHLGSSGAEKVIPISDAPKGEVKMGKDYVIPSKEGWLRFDDNPGIEKLKLVFASIKSSSEVLTAMKQGDDNTAFYHQLAAITAPYEKSPNLSVHTESGSKDLIVETGSPSSSKDAGVPTSESFNVSGATDFKVDSSVYNAPGNYIVNNAKGSVKEPVVVEIALTHQ